MKDGPRWWRWKDASPRSKTEGSVKTGGTHFDSDAASYRAAAPLRVHILQHAAVQGVHEQDRLCRFQDYLLLT